jgi:hypothetical protein
MTKQEKFYIGLGLNAMLDWLNNLRIANITSHRRKRGDSYVPENLITYSKWKRDILNLIKKYKINTV